MATLFHDATARQIIDAVRRLQSQYTNIHNTLAMQGLRRHEVRDDNSQTLIVHFELVQNLVLREPTSPVAEHALARILEWDGNSWELTDEYIEVYDWFGEEGMWNGLGGYRGWARKHIERPPNDDVDGGRQAYEIIWMERKAQLIRFTTTENMSDSIAGAVAVTLDLFDWQGKAPVGTINVYDPCAAFQDVPVDALGVAYYNNRDERYEIVECQRLVKIATATLNGAMCGSTATIDGFQEQLIGEFVVPPVTLPTTASNPCGLAGLDNDLVLLRRANNGSLPNGNWEIIQVKHHVKTVMVDVQVSGLTLQKKSIEAYVQICDNATPSWTTWHTGEEC